MWQDCQSSCNPPVARGFLLRSMSRFSLSGCSAAVGLSRASGSAIELAGLRLSPQERRLYEAVRGELKRERIQGLECTRWPENKESQGRNPPSGTQHTWTNATFNLQAWNIGTPLSDYCVHSPIFYIRSASAQRTTMRASAHQHTREAPARPRRGRLAPADTR